MVTAESPACTINRASCDIHNMALLSILMEALFLRAKGNFDRYYQHSVQAGGSACSHNNEVTCSSSFLFLLCALTTAIVQGQVENTKVQELKYGSEKKSRLSVSSALLTHNCVLTDVLQRSES